ncbi:MAG: response regulator [Magnetococcales bacterium]|nr:response regulator [Magnetococcales bacterium]
MHMLFDLFNASARHIACVVGVSGLSRRFSAACETILGYPPDALPSLRDASLVHPDDLTAVLDALDQVLGQRPVSDFVCRCRHRDGGYRWLEWQAIRAGEAIHAVARDITEHKAAVALAEESGAARKEFFSLIGHEVRTPLHVLLGMCGILQESDLTPEQHHYTNLMQQAGNTLMGIVDDIQELSRIESGGIVPRADACQPVAILRGAIEGLRSVALQQQVRVRERIEGHLVDLVVQVDPACLRQVMHNLIGHAIKSTHHSQLTVAISLWPEDRRSLMLTIARDVDDIAPDGPESRAERGGLVGGNTGLALAIARKLVAAMGGRLRVRERVGEGVDVVCILPVGEAASAASPVLETGAMEILLVENSEDNQILCEAYLKRTPHRLTIVNDGIEALDRVQRHLFDLVLMDLRMPNMDGLEATRRIRLWERETGRVALKVIALTAHAMPTTLRECLDAGCDDLLQKPFEKADLLRIINENYKKHP